MEDRRIDRIKKWLEKLHGRSTFKELLEKLKKEEDYPDLPIQSIYIAIQQENQRFKELGDHPPFITRSEGEERGYVSLRKTETETGSEANISESIHSQNKRIDAEIIEWLKSMDWRTFESKFLVQVLEGLGFNDIKITPPTRDGGYDALAVYRNGILSSKPIISAKHWKAGTVGVQEVRSLRGIPEAADITMIVTTTKFSEDAQKEAERREHGLLPVYLIDRDMLIDICKRAEIGVKKRRLPELLVIDPKSDASANIDVDAKTMSSDRKVPHATPQEDESAQRGGGNKMYRFRNEMLNDLSPEEIAKLSGYSLNTVRNYLSTDRRDSLGDAIRENPDSRDQALKIVEKKRL